MLLEATLRTLLLGIAFESNAQDPGRRPTLVCESDGGILVLDVVTCEARQAPMVRPSVEVGWSWQVGDVNWIARSGSIHAVRGWIVYEMFAANAPDKKRLLVGGSMVGSQAVSRCGVLLARVSCIYATVIKRVMATTR